SFSHMELIEGNMAPHVGAVASHGNAGYFTFFRNYHSSHSADPSVADSTLPRGNNITAFELQAGAIGMNVVGCVLGQQGITHEFDTFTSSSSGAIYEIGQGLGGLGKNDVAFTTLLRTGNYDYAHNATQWIDNTPAPLPASLYLRAVPSWWPQGTPLPWLGP